MLKKKMSKRLLVSYEKYAYCRNKGNIAKAECVCFSCLQLSLNSALIIRSLNAAASKKRMKSERNQPIEKNERIRKFLVILCCHLEEDSNTFTVK